MEDISEEMDCVPGHMQKCQEASATSVTDPADLAMFVESSELSPMTTCNMLNERSRSFNCKPG
jgi:hypothetical protein